MNYSAPRKQQGMVLVISLLLTLVMTILAISSMNLAGGSLEIVKNKQADQQTMSAANTVIEETLSDLANFTAPDKAVETRSGVTLTRTKPVCRSTLSSPGWSYTSPVALQHNYFEFSVTASRASDGSVNQVNTGVRILMNADTCS